MSNRYRFKIDLKALKGESTTPAIPEADAPPPEDGFSLSETSRELLVRQRNTQKWQRNLETIPPATSLIGEFPQGYERAECLDAYNASLAKGIATPTGTYIKNTIHHCAFFDHYGNKHIILTPMAHHSLRITELLLEQTGTLHRFVLEQLPASPPPAPHTYEKLLYDGLSSLAEYLDDIETEGEALSYSSPNHILSITTYLRETNQLVEVKQSHRRIFL